MPRRWACRWPGRELGPSTSDVAIVDVRLPTARIGLDLIRNLAAVLPVLAISINGTGRHAALAAGARAYVEKDGAPDALITALQHLVARPA